MGKAKYPIAKPAGWRNGALGVYLDTRSPFGIRAMCAYCGKQFAGWDPHYTDGPCKKSQAAKQRQSEGGA